jgi:hypothetical protein
MSQNKERGTNAFGNADSLQLQTIAEMLRDMKYGSVTIIVQDGKVIQIDKTEKYRIKN